MHTTGFASPAQGYEAESIDYNRLLIQHPAACFQMRYTGQFLPEYSITNGDILIVDSAVQPAAGKLAVILADGEFITAELAKSVPAGSCGFTYTDGRGRQVPVQELFGIVTGIIRLL